MDTARNLYKALICDFSIQKVVDHLISENNRSDESWFCDELKETLHDTDSSRNMQEAETLVNLYQEEWVNKQQPSQIVSPMSGTFKLISHCAKQFLEYKNGYLLVTSKHLLGWNEVTRMTGEDLLVCAWKGMVSRETPTTFAWPDVLNCGGETVQKISQEGLCDIHTHLGGAADPFIMNWLCLMTGEFLNDRQFESEDGHYNHMRIWSVLAARIRIALYRYYILGRNNAFGETFQTCLKEIIQPNKFIDSRNQVKALTEQLMFDGKQTIEALFVDYAIHKDCEDACLDSPYMLWHGERKLLYSFFRDYMTGSKDVKKIARYVYLYCLIRNQFREEMMVTRKHMGLSYFKFYNRRKYSFIRNELKELVWRYAFQTSLRRNNKDGVEMRINASQREINSTKNNNLNKCIFVNSKWLSDEQLSNVSFLIHLSKSRFQKETSEEAGRTYVQKLLENEFRPRNGFVGIDAAGEEMICRPEKLGHYYRYLRERGHRNFTFHVGEDFCDVADGLRAIDETITFLNVKKGWRLGHCVAMGIDVASYYKKKKYQIYLTKQMLLDNLVWVLVRSTEFGIRVQGKLKGNMLKKIEKLYLDMGFETHLSLEAYYHSMWLRSDVKEIIEEKDHIAWEHSMKCCHPRSEEARKNYRATMIAHEFRVREDIRYNGKKPEEWRITAEYERIIKKLQKKMAQIVRQLKVGIECNPTSNLMLCNIDRYDQEPLLRFRRVLPHLGFQLPVSINTDDKGLFATSLLNEYSLMASAISKQECLIWKLNWSKKLIQKYLQDISRRGNEMRFNWNNNEYESNRF